MSRAKTTVAGHKKIRDAWWNILQVARASAVEPEEELGNRIIVPACRELAEALLDLKKHPRDRYSLEMRDRCLEFLRGDFFAALTDLDPEYLIRRITEHPETVQLRGDCP